MILLTFVEENFFGKLYISEKKNQMVEKKQLLIILPFWGHLSFETRNRLNNCIRNQLPSCSLRIVFQTKTRLSSLFKFKAPEARILFTNFRVVAAAQLIMVKVRDIFLYEHWIIWESLH